MQASLAIHKHTGTKMVPTKGICFAREVMKNLSVALPSGRWYTVQVLAPVAAVVPILALEEHHQDNHKSASQSNICQASSFDSSS